MGVRGHILPVYRRWATFVARSPETHADCSRHRFCYIPSVERWGETSPRPSPITGQGRGRLVSGGQYRYLSNYGRGSDDDDSTDLREQKSAFLRALEGSKQNNENKDGQRSKSSNSKTLTTRENRDIDKSRKKNNIIRRKGGNRRDRKTTITSPSKKLTLDEFFSNLEKTKSEELSPKPRTRKRSRARVSSQQGKIGNPDPRTPSNHNNRKSQGAPAADMSSFFDEVNALMDRQAKEEKLQATTVDQRKDGIGSVDSALNSRLSISDIIPPPFTGNDSDLLDDRNSVGYNCSVESWKQYSEMLDEVIEGPKFLARFYGKRNESKSEDEAEKARQIREVVEWLNSKTPLVESNLPTLNLALAGELSNTSDDSETKATESDDDSEITTATNGSYTSRRHLFRAELDSQKELFLNNSGWTKKQYEVATGALVAMGNLCARNCTAPPLDAAWSKLKELGYPMKNKDVLHNYLYVASTFSLPKRKFTLADERFDDNQIGSEDSSPSVMDLLYGTSEMYSSVGSSDDLEDEIDLSAEVALCHDFLHEATEQSTGIHVRRLVQLGRANEAEILLEATMVSWLLCPRKQ